MSGPEKKVSKVKFDKEMVIAFVLCGLLLVFWQPLCVKMGWMPDPAAAAAAAPSPAAAPAVVEQPVEKAAVAVKAAEKTAKNTQEPVISLPAVTLENKLVSCTILPETGAVTGITLKTFKTADRKQDIVVDQLPSAKTAGGALQPGALGVFLPGTPLKHLHIVSSEVSADHRTYTLIRDAVAGTVALRITQVWTLGDDHVLKMALTVENPSERAVVLNNLTVSGGELQGWQNVSGDVLRMDSHKLDYYLANGSYEDVNIDAKDSKFFRQANDVQWAALSNKFFISVLKSGQPFTLYQARVLEPGSSERYFAAAGAQFNNVQLAPGKAANWDFQLYAGPKTTALKSFAPDADRTMHLAWGPLDYLARLLLWVLIQLKGLCGSYGWSIIIMTILVRLLFWPATAKANASMKKMSKVQPQIQELRAKYKDNPQMLNTKMMELYRKEGVNPMGGCLPILLQIPVFFALYATLDGAVELRQVPFWWATDLAAPDTVAHIFGLAINPLVLAMTLLMVVQQRLTPTAMDPMQQKMMMIMPIVMLFFLYNLPSGLTLYWTVSQIFSILQMLLQKHHNTAASAPKAGSAQKA